MKRVMGREFRRFYRKVRENRKENGKSFCYIIKTRAFGSFFFFLQRRRYDGGTGRDLHERQSSFI